MITPITKIIVAVCTLANFRGMPRHIEGPVAFATKKIVVVRLVNNNRTQAIEVTFQRNRCKLYRGNDARIPVN